MKTTLVSMLAALAATASCGGGGGGPDIGSLVLLSTVGTRSYGVTADGKGHAYVNDDYGVSVVDVGNGKDAAIVGAIESQPRIGQQSRSMLLSGNTLYSAHGSRVDIIDVATPTAPQNRAQIAGSGLIWDLALVGNVLYFADEASGVWAYDVSDPAAPVMVSSVAPGPATGVVATDRNVFVTGNGLTSIDISGGAYQVNGTTGAILARDAELVGGYVFAMPDNGGIWRFDVRDPHNPVDLLNFSTTGSYVGSTVVGSRLYAAGVAVDVFDVSNPASPTLAGEMSTGGEDVAVDDRFVYVVNGLGLSIWGSP